jgi:hypothetical protein
VETSEVRAVCVRSARTDPCGGCRATGIPTATGGLSGRLFRRQFAACRNVGRDGILRATQYRRPHKDELR